MDTSTSPLHESAQETRAALDEIRRHERLLAGSWRELLDAAERQLDGWRAHGSEDLVLRAARASAAAAAGEAAQTARFNARLLRYTPDELAQGRTELEARIESLRASERDAAAHLNATVTVLLAGPADDQARVGQAAAAARHASRLVDDTDAAMRGYGDHLEQLLLEFSDGARATFGQSIGGILPTRGSREPRRTSLDRARRDVRGGPPAELADAVWAWVELYRDTLDARLNEAIRTVRSCVERSAEFGRLGAAQARERAELLLGEARELDRLAERMDWMLPTDYEVATCARRPPVRKRFGARVVTRRSPRQQA